MTCLTSYFALRVCSQAGAQAWWNGARRESDTAPRAIRALLSGRTRVELSLDEAREALAWAEGIEGWPQDGLAPFSVHPELPLPTDD